jgi:IS30 family transposase
MQRLALALKKAQSSFFWPRPKEGGLGCENYSSYFWVAKLIKQMAQLTLEQRYRIEFCLLSKMPYSQIGDYIDKDKSVISREISRNSDARNGQYKAELAHRKANDRHSTKKKKKYFTPEIETHVREYIAQDYSPEQIAGRAILEDIPCVSHERIYQFIWNDKKKGGLLYKHLRNRGKRYRKRGHSKDNRGLIAGRVDIDQR